MGNMIEWRYRLLLMGAFVVGLYLAVFNWHCPEIHTGLALPCSLLPEIPRRIGDALIIAPILALIVDEAAKTKLLREFSLDVSSHIIGRMLPPELRDHLHGYLQMFLVRTRWDITHTIEKWGGQEGFIRLETTSEYDMENHSGYAKDYEFVYAVEDSLYPLIGTTQITSVRLGEENYAGKSLAKVILAENGYQRFSRRKELQPHSGRNSPSYIFEAKSIECFRESGFFPFTAICPVMKAVLCVWYPTEDFQVRVELTYDDLNTGADQKEITDGTRKGTKWTI